MTDIVLREASFNDAKIIFDLSNEEDVRRNSINKKSIEWETHLQWLKSKLDDNKYKILLFFTGDKFLGQVKFEIRPPDAIISISLHRDFRGKGLSTIVLKKAIEYYLLKNNLIDNIIALIRPENESSIRSFSKAKFVLHENEMINHDLYLKYIYTR